MKAAIYLRDKSVTLDDTDTDQVATLIDRWQAWQNTQSGNPGVTINAGNGSFDVDYRDILRIDVV